jgi:hypothetical protein
VEPPHSYVHDASSSVVHHQDYLNRGSDQPLCGATFEKPARLDPTIRPDAVCPDCEAKLAAYHLIWWRERAEAATAELDGLRVKYRELSEYVDNQRRQVAGSQHPVPVPGGPSGENTASRSEIDGEPLDGATSEHGETTPTPLLDQARKELLELCRPFDDAVPYWRVKNCIDAFSDKLESDERVLLANEIGADGSFTRWCIREIEGLGWHVTNSPVSGDARRHDGRLDSRFLPTAEEDQMAAGPISVVRRKLRITSTAQSRFVDPVPQSQTLRVFVFCT